MVFVRGKANDVVRVALAQVVDLIELQIVVFRGVERDAVVQGQWNVAFFEEADHVVEVFFGRAAGRGDDREFLRGDLFDQRPVGNVGTGNLDDGHAEFNAQIDGAFVEWRGHGDGGQLADFRYHARKIRLGQFGVFRFLDVTDVLVAFEVLVHELLDIAELELDGRLDVVVADHGGVIADDLQAALKTSPVVIGQFEDEQVLEDVVAFFRNEFMGIVQATV